MQHLNWIPAALIVFGAGIIGSNAVFLFILREVNERLPPREQYSFFELRGVKSFKVLRDHSSLYPGDYLPALYWLLVGLSVLAWLSMVLSSIASR
jgi:hypothetical protein